MLNLRVLTTKLSSLLERIDHGAPAAAVNDQTIQNQANHTNTTMTNRSTSTHDEPPVQH